MLRFRTVDTSNWRDFESLFECRGGPHYCWCMAWRRVGPVTGKPGKADRKAAIQTLVNDHVPVGILAYLDDTPVGWCSVAPRTSHRRLGGCELTAVEADRIWSITCFFIPRTHRGRGLTAKLLSHAVEYAAAQGASHVEAYPVSPDSPSYGFMGRVSTFEKAGFNFQHMAGTRRHVMLLDLTGEG